MIEYILKKDALRFMDGTGNAPIHIAARISDCNVVEMLIKYGVDVDAFNNEGDHPICSVSSGSWATYR
jgi:ankyrin repeat protein